MLGLPTRCADRWRLPYRGPSQRKESWRGLMGFRKKGFFHFVHNYAEPLVELRKALENRSECVRDSLIVLPEAFNIGKYYKEAGNANHDPDVLTKLQTIAGEFHLTFVAGLIVKQNTSPTPPYSSGYLIDETCRVLMCRKKQRDSTTEEYTLCKEGDCDHDNPTWHNAVCLITLICIDNSDCQRKNTLLTKFPDSAKLICIPACIGACGTTAEAIAEYWGKNEVILANSDQGDSNSDHRDVGSFISKEGKIVVKETGTKNLVVLR
jgi:predicted amidohydrolase